MKPKANIVDLPVYQPGKPIEQVKREFGLSEVIKLASNENPYGCSPHAKEAIVAELSNLSMYPDGSASELSEELASFMGVKKEQIIFGCGSDEIIALITRAYLEPGDETIMADQTFSVYKSNADIEKAVSIEVPLADGTHDLDAMLNAVTDRTKIVWICNPNNPTGTIISENELVRFMESVPKHVMVVLDEAYSEFVLDPTYPKSLKLLDQYHNLVILKTFSKIYGLAALRIGYGIGQADVIQMINQVREPFNTGRPAQAAAKAALRDQKFVDDCRQRNAEGIMYLQKEFDRMGLRYFPAHGNFIMVDVLTSGQDVFQSLLSKGIIVRPGFARYPSYIRVSVGTPEQNKMLIYVLEQVLRDVKSTV